MNMHRALLRSALPALLLFTTALHPVRAQHPTVQAILNEMHIDSMMLYVRQLSGELPVDVGNGPQLIMSRHKNNPGNAVAQAYIQQKLVQFGYSPQVQSFSSTGKNVLATLTGAVNTTTPLVVGAHYDAMPGGVYDAPAADDNGSGTATLLELARVLAGHEFEYSIVFAFWDEEEQGLVGSAFHAGGLAANDVVLRGVVNMDAISYDGNADTKARIHARTIGNSLALADTVFSMRAQYNIDLDLLLTVPGATYSDHASFWNEGYGAILIIEEFGADGNPFYHTPNDRVEHFDVPYYEKLSRLSLATVATLAVPMDPGVGMELIQGLAPASLHAFPNPAADQVHVWLTVPKADRYSITVIDALGSTVLEMHEGMLPAGRHAFDLPLQGLPAGSYLLRAASGSSTATLRVLRIP
jgi:hypothetical protein